MNPPPASSAPARGALIPEASARPGDDPIFVLNAEAERRRRAGEPIVNATLGALMEDDGQLAILPVVQEAFAAVDPRHAAGYAPIAGEPGFLEAVVLDLLGPGPLAEQSVAVATPGATGAIHHAIVNFLEPGQALLTPSYFWGPYEILATQTRRRVETFSMFDARGGFDLAAFEKALSEQVARQGRSLVVLNTPCNNPTGYSLDRGELRGVARIVGELQKQAPVALLLDHAYAKFGRQDERAWSQELAELADPGPLLVAWTVSKSFAQCGARVGALVALCADPAERQRILAALSFSCRGTWSNCNHLGLLAITHLLGDDARRARADRERERLIAFLGERVRAFNQHAAREGLRHPRCEGGFFVTVFAPDAGATARRMRELGVYVVPARGGVRVALCSTPARDVPRLVRALSEGLRPAGA